MTSPDDNVTTTWREMRSADLPAVSRLADDIHPTLHEDVAVFANRLDLFARGCFVLEGAGEFGPEGNELAAAPDAPILGYAVAHPWQGAAPPSLDTVLEALPSDPDRFYVHDVAIVAAMRGRGHAETIVDRLLAASRPYGPCFLVSVYGTGRFWARFGFVDAADDLPGAALAAYGPDARYMIRAPQD